MLENLISKCRICLERKSRLPSIFGSASEEKYGDLIKKYTGIEVIQKDNLPSGICAECLYDLSIVIRFVDKVRQSNEKLNEALDLNRSTPTSVELDDYEDEEKIPLSILGASLKKEFSGSEAENALDYCSYDDNCDGSDSKLLFKEEPECLLVSAEVNSKLNDFGSISIKNELEVLNSKNPLYSKSTSTLKSKKLSTSKLKYEIIRTSELGVDVDLYKCLTCGTLLRNINRLQHHYRKHITSSKPYKCLHCEMCFSKIGPLNNHIKHSHSCSHPTANTSSLPVCHNSTAPDENIVKSEGVDEEYNSLSNVCDIYSSEKIKSSSNANSMFTIIKTEKPGYKKELVQCLICGQVMVSKSVFMIHYRKHTGEKPFVCKYCAKCFTQVGTLNDHIKGKHPQFHSDDSQSAIAPSRRKQTETIYTCDTCAKTFLKKGHLSTHLRTHSNEKTIGCLYCPLKFRSYSVRVVHIRVHHTKEKPYVCHICGKAVASTVELRSHMTKHSDERRFKCHLCSMAVKSYGNLKKHMMRKHSTEKPHICEVCGANYALKYNLTEHMKVRHSERSGLCEICLKSFSDLEGHMRNHTGEKPFTCQTCSKKFSQKRGLLLHSRLRH